MNTFFILPQTKIIKQIEKIRKSFDPLYSKIPAHITIIFPDNFSKTETELIECVNNISVKKFSLKTIGLKMSFEGDKNYIFLVFEDFSLISDLQKILYKKIYNKDNANTYFPHITLACLKTKEECLKVFENISSYNWKSKIIIDNICIERIELDDVSNVIFHKFFS